MKRYFYTNMFLAWGFAKIVRHKSRHGDIVLCCAVLKTKILECYGIKSGLR